MPNIKLSYLYRDSCNYKNYGYAIFADLDNISLEQLETMIRSRLIDGKWFYANEWNLPNLFTNDIIPNLDPGWHEFESVEYTEESTNYALYKLIQLND